MNRFFQILCVGIVTCVLIGCGGTSSSSMSKMDDKMGKMGGDKMGGKMEGDKMGGKMDKMEGDKMGGKMDKMEGEKEKK